MTRLRPGMRSETAEAVNQVSTTFRGAPLAPLLIACGRPNHERSSPPLLTVLLLLTGEHQEEGDGEKNERAGPLEWVGTPGVFFWHSVEAERPVSEHLSSG